MHDEAMAWVAAAVAELDVPPASVIEFGARDVNGSVRHLFSGATYTGVDIDTGPGVDVVCPAEHYAHGSLVDVVVCTEVLEHTPNGAAICAAAADNLRSGGVFILTAAGPGRKSHSAVDGLGLRDGEHYANVTPQDLGQWLAAAGFASWTIDMQPRPADIRAVAIR